MNFTPRRRSRVSGFALRLAATLLAGAALLAAPASAQDTGRWEVGAFTGGSFGSRTFLDRSADIRIGSASAFGLRGAYSVDRSFSLELSLSRASARLTGIDPSTGAALAPSAPIDVNTYEVDGLYGFGAGRMRGYIGLGVGAMTLHPHVPGIATKPDTRFAVNAALGGKLYLSDRLALRADARYRWRSASRGTAPAVCGSLGCYGFTTDLYSSAEVTGGLSYRFGGARIWDLPAPPASTTSSAVLASPSRKPTPPERFFTAAGEIALIELLPWAYDRYATKEDFAFISTESVKENFRSGFGYDRDAFNMNQAAHPFHGNLYFNAARSNGYSYWESGAFTLSGSFLWECCMENTQPAINDLVNTTLGGMALGEMAHRLGVMLRDNTASGFRRFVRALRVHRGSRRGGHAPRARGHGTRVPEPRRTIPQSVQRGRRPRVPAHRGRSRRSEPGVPLPFRGLRRRFRRRDPEAVRHVLARGRRRLHGPGPGRGPRNPGRGGAGRPDRPPAARLRRLPGVRVLQQRVAGLRRADLQHRPLVAIQPAEGLTSAPASRRSSSLSAGIRTTDFLNPENCGATTSRPAAGSASPRVSTGRNGRSSGSATASPSLTRRTGALLQQHAAILPRLGAPPPSRSVGVGAGYSWYSRRTTYQGFDEAPRTQSEWRAFASLSL